MKRRAVGDGNCRPKLSKLRYNFNLNRQSAAFDIETYSRKNVFPTEVQADDSAVFACSKQFSAVADGYKASST